RMDSLGDLDLKTSYHKGRDDIAEQFYLPCMRRAKEFDRAVGYFRSTVFIIAWPALRTFVARGGKIRVLCSQVLAAEDIDALGEGYTARADAALADRMRDEIRSLIREEQLRECAKVLAALVAGGSLDLQVAVMKAEDSRGTHARIFHDKLGLFRDSVGNL